MKKLLFCALVGAVALSPMHLVEARACPALADGVRVFPDHTIGVVGKLEVDTDGAAASYSPGNHGFSYIVDGVDRLDGDRISACSTGNQAACNADWAADEKADFGPGTKRFCSFAIAVDPWREGQKVTTCKKGLIIGDGLGRPRLGAPYPAAAGGTTRPYASETSLHQLVGGRKSSIDLGSVPGVVVPKDRADLIGSIAWVRFGKVSTFACVSACKSAPLIGVIGVQN